MHRIEETIARDICIGCGACAAASGGAIEVSLSSYGIYKPNLLDASEEQIRSASRVCPFSDESLNEDVLSAPQADEAMVKDSKLGSFSQTMAGRVSDDDYLPGSSSGGLTSWLIAELLRTDKIDAVINVGRQDQDSSEIFGYQETSDLNRLFANRKSHYYAATLSDALETVTSSPEKRYAVVGVPCFIKAVRSLCVEKPELRMQIKYFIGLVCGHYKTQAFGESLAWQLDIPPNDLKDLDFRLKDPQAPASRYKFAAQSESGEWRSARTGSLVGGSWGYNAFQPEACNFCDDVVGETADISFGDAWLPQFTADARGTNIVISRNRELDRLIEEGRVSGEVELQELSPEQVIESQAGGFRHRREGLAIRLADDIAEGKSVPHKRVAPDSNAVPTRRKRLLRQRRKMAALSHVAFLEAKKEGNLNLYLKPFNKEIRRYNLLDARLFRRLFGRLKRFLNR